MPDYLAVYIESITGLVQVLAIEVMLDGSPYMSMSVSMDRYIIMYTVLPISIFLSMSRPTSVCMSMSMSKLANYGFGKIH